MNAATELVQKVGFTRACELLSVKPDELAKVIIDDKASTDFEFFAKEKLWIRTKTGELKPLLLNRGQRKILEAVERQRKAGRPVRIKLLKARQFGGSTEFQGLFFKDLISEKHLLGLTLCHDLESARNMRSMFDRYYDNFKGRKPERKTVSEKWWKFKGSDSDYLIDTADELDTGRSFSVHRLHCSEVAFYRNPDVLMVGLLQAVPNNPNTMVFIESTGNGIGDWFYRFIKADNDYELIFVAWYEIEEYTRSFTSDKEKTDLEGSLESYEKELQKQGVTLEQLNWRRYVIDNQLNGDERKFMQEYPANVDEAFQASGRPYFPVTLIREKVLKTEKLKPLTGFLEWNEYGKSVDVVEDNSGYWKFFEKPLEGFKSLYVTGSDVAEGKMVVEGKKEPDRSVCTVWNRKSGRDSARFAGRMDTDLFADEIYKASVFYGSACDCVEANKDGKAVIDALKYKDNLNLYRRETFGKVDDQETVEYGFLTTGGAAGGREIALSDLRRALREGSYDSDDVEFWEECLTFAYDDKGKPQAQSGCFDDRVMSSAMVLQASQQAADLYEIKPVEVQKKLEPDNDDYVEEETSYADY